MDSFQQWKETLRHRPKVAKSIVDLVGATPLLRLNKLGASLEVDLIAKLESMNPCSSVKERIAKSMIEAAEARGEI